ICRGGKINMKKPGVDLSQGHATGGRTVDGQHHFISTGGWRIPGAKVCSDKAIGIARPGKGDGKGYGVGRTASKHRRTVERKSAYTNKGCIINKQVDCEKIGVLGPTIVPYREFRVV